MAPKPIVGRYKLYKAGTSKLINWLAKTGSIYCDLKKVLKSLKCGLPGKKRTSKKDLEQIEVTTRELIRLAELIGAGKPPPDIPEAIITIARDVIKGREECAEWYAAQALVGDGKLEKENDTHRHFITVLHRVLNLLVDARDKQQTSAAATEETDTEEAARPVEKKSKRSKKSKTASASTACSQDKLSNLFSVLHLEEPLPSTLGDDRQPQTGQPATTPAPLDFKLEMEDDDGAFATWCFLADLNDVRSFVKETWREYLRGEISFLAASTVTDTAFGLLRCADEDFQNEKKGCQSTNWTDVLEYLGLTWFNRERVTWLCPITHGIEPKIPTSDVNIVELLCPIGFTCLWGSESDLDEICQAIKEKKPLPTPCDNGRHDFHQFASVLSRLAEELHEVSHTHTCEHIVIDEFVQGLAQAHRALKEPMWLVVACQIYIDIYSLLGTHVSHGAEALQETLRNNKAIGEQLKEYRLESGDDLSDVQEAVTKLKWISKATNRFEELSDDDDAGQKNFLSKAKPGCSASPMEQSLPAHAGAILADLKIGLYTAGIQFANHNFLVLSTAHLYKALRAMGVLTDDWHDMDWVLSSFKKKQPLVAKMGSTYDGEAAARCYLLALGFPLAEVVRGVRHVGTKGSKVVLNEARKIVVNSPLLQKMSDRQGCWEKHGLGYSKSRNIEVFLQILTSSDQDSKKPGPRESFTPVQLLSTFKKTILTNELSLNFDYVSFTIACARLLHSIAQQVGKKAGPIVWVQGKLGIKAADGAVQTHVPMISHLLRSEKTSIYIKKAASLFSNHISSTGKAFTKQASDQSSGRIPKDLRPKIESELARVERDQDMWCTIFEYSNTKYVISGETMAAYHPSIISEDCNRCANCRGPPRPEETAPGVGKVIVFGSAVPSGIMKEAVVAAQKNPKKYFESKTKRVMHFFNEHATGRITEAELRRQVKALRQLDLEPIVDLSKHPASKIAWAYRVTPGSFPYDSVFRRFLVAGKIANQELYGSILMVPVEMMEG